ncbi:probable WRKY transcription factor 33 [Syzygium oleosum]|uniref:probable WRKY transcription factor 33 n=1 Tax=Syzygium oleosum TaxID=219896 RepID=UPI0024B8C50E|nr:probable WRKY transcription factor 33 [Syzygium oleosum]
MTRESWWKSWVLPDVFAPIQNSANPASQKSPQSLTPPSETFQADGNTNRPNQPSYFIKEQRISDDGYNWRKYGQKQVKGSENLRSYYKCTYPGCPTKKKVERSLDGHVTEIVYRGNHNHPRPLPASRSSSQSSQPPSSCISYLENPGQLASVACSEKGQQDSSASLGDDDSEVSSQMSDSTGDDDGNEPEAKRLRGGNESKGYSSSGNRTVREPRFAFRTTSEVDILDDGYRWRKYGQKTLKGNPNPRSYYKCRNIGCPVRKWVERSSDDMRTLITTYQGQHNHDGPASVAEERKTEVSTVDARGILPKIAPSEEKEERKFYGVDSWCLEAERQSE